MHEYGLLDHAHVSPFRWLQSLGDPALAFVVVNPFDFFSDYDFEIGDANSTGSSPGSAGEACLV